MAKVVKRKQPLRIAGKAVNTEAVNTEATPAEKKVPVKKEKATPKPKAPSKASEKKAKEAEKSKEAQAKMDACGYKIGDEVMMKSGRIVKVTKMTNRPQGIHLWWETEAGPSAGGHYTFGVKGKMVDGKCTDPLTGEEIAMPEPKAKKKAKAKAEPKADKPTKNAVEIDENEVFENEAGDGFELEDGTPCNEDGTLIEE